MTIKIEYGENNLKEYMFTVPSLAPEPPPYLLEAAFLIGKNKAPDLVFDTIPENDDYIFDELILGSVEGVYLLEKYGAQCFTQLLEPRCISDLIYVLALDSPGPLLSGALSEYIDRNSPDMPISFMHAKLKSILRNSYGAILYRNQVIEIAKVIAGYSGEELEYLRMTLESCDPGGISNHRYKFVTGAGENLIDQPTAESIFKRIAFFSRYDFRDEWQAADHALLSYRSAYLKFHYPEEYLTAFDNCNRSKVQPTWETGEAVAVLSPLVDRLMQARMAVENFPDKVNSYRHQIYANMFGTKL